MDLYYFELDLECVHNLQHLFSLCGPQSPFQWPTNSWPGGFEWLRKSSGNWAEVIKHQNLVKFNYSLAKKKEHSEKTIFEIVLKCP